jgi:multidrug efflux pump subunit AcrA (membrane-fusion protein)
MEQTQNKTDTIIKIVLLALIAVFLGAAVFSMFRPKQAAGAPGGQQTAARSASQGQAGTQGSGGAGARPAGTAPGSQGQAGTPGGQGGTQSAAQGASRQGGAQANPAAITVNALRMSPSVIRQTVKLNGDVSSTTSVGIFPDTSGKLVSLRKDVGDRVERGEIIGYVDPSRAGAAYEQSPVRSTVGGTVIALPVSEGETVTASTRIATVGSLGSLKITIYVAEKYSAYVRRGLPAVVSFAAAPGERFAASVDTVSPVVNAANRTIETTLVLTRGDPRVKPGMFADVDLVIREKTDTFVLPKTAVKNYNDGQVIYIIDANNIARRIPVTTGLFNDSETEILSGLSFDDLVVTAGAVTDGSPVRIVAGIN